MEVGEFPKGAGTTAGRAAVALGPGGGPLARKRLAKGIEFMIERPWGKCIV